MKIKLLIIVFIGFIFSSCNTGHSVIEIINEGEKDLLYYYGKYEIKDSREVNYVEYYVQRIKNRNVDKKQTIARSHDIFVDTSFETYIKNSPIKYLEFYVFTLDTMLKYREGYRMSYLIENKLYDQKINFTEDTLNDLDWVITIK